MTHWNRPFYVKRMPLPTKQYGHPIVGALIIVVLGSMAAAILVAAYVILAILVAH